MNSESVEVTHDNESMNKKSLTPLDTQSLDSNEDATERTPTPRVSRKHSRKNDKDADNRRREKDDHRREVTSDDESEEGDKTGSDYNSSDYETDSTGSSGSETSFLDISTQPMYTILSAFLESPDPESRINVTEAILELKGSVDRVADMLEKLVSKRSSTVL